MVLPNITDNQLYRLTSLPYRVGLYVSQSDQSGGDAANENELRAIENLIYGFADGVFGSELVQNIMAETIKQKDKWSDWDQHLEQVPDECTDALAILSPYVDYKESTAYAMRLMDIGEAVALAFREDIAGQAGFGRILAYLRYLSYAKKAKAKKLPVRNFEDFLSISNDERRALVTVAESLSIDYI